MLPSVCQWMLRPLTSSCVCLRQKGKSDWCVWSDARHNLASNFEFRSRLPPSNVRGRENEWMEMEDNDYIMSLDPWRKIRGEDTPKSLEGMSSENDMSDGGCILVHHRQPRPNRNKMPCRLFPHDFESIRFLLGVPIAIPGINCCPQAAKGQRVCTTGMCRSNVRKFRSKSDSDL